MCRSGYWQLLKTIEESQMSGSQKKGEELFDIPLFKSRVAINSLLRSKVNMITFSYILLVVICILLFFNHDLRN